MYFNSPDFDQFLRVQGDGYKYDRLSYRYWLDHGNKDACKPSAISDQRSLGCLPGLSLGLSGVGVGTPRFG